MRQIGCRVRSLSTGGRYPGHARSLRSPFEHLNRRIQLPRRDIRACEVVTGSKGVWVIVPEDPFPVEKNPFEQRDGMYRNALAIKKTCNSVIVN